MPVIALVAAGSRLGMSLARIFGTHGYDVALIARSPGRLEGLTQTLTSEGITAAAFPADVTDPAALTAALASAAGRLGRVDVLHYASPAVGTGVAVRDTGALDVTPATLAPQIESVCNGAITATRAVLPAMLTAGTGTLLYTTGASAILPVPVFVTAGMAGAALRKWVLTLNRAVADKGIHAAHVAIGTWLEGTPGAPPGTPLTSPDAIAREYWTLHTDREPADHLISG